MRNSNITKRTLAAGLLIGGLLGWLINDYLDENDSKALPMDEGAEVSELDLETFWEVWEELNEEYYDLGVLDPETAIHGAISGMVEALGDPFSSFLTAQDAEELNINLTGELVGIGAELSVDGGRLMVVSPIKGAPAEAAGIQPKDYILSVDGEPTSEMTLIEAVLKIRGEAGTEVTLLVLHEGAEDPEEIVIVRDKIQVPSVNLTFDEQNGKKVAHLALYQFSDDTEAELSEAVREITLQGADALILDLRLNGGGYLDTSIQVIDHFFDESVKAVIVRDRGEEDDIVYTSGNGDLAEIPMVLLIDSGSASASEIVAGALKDHERAVLMGVTSFGKGSVQQVRDLSDGSSLKITIAKWFTPDDRTIDEVGETPDIVVEMDPNEIDTENDLQYQAALDYLTK